MANAVVSVLADNIICNQPSDTGDDHSNLSSETVIGAPDSQEQLSITSGDLPEDHSIFSRDVDRWIRGETSPIDIAVQSPGVTALQRSTLVTSASLDASGIWYLAAMVLPIISLNNTMLWRCTPSSFLNTAEVVFTQVARLCALARVQLRRLAHEHAARDLFATAMDIVLVFYAIGFLVISMYQASVIRN